MKFLSIIIIGIILTVGVVWVQTELDLPLFLIGLVALISIAGAYFVISGIMYAFKKAREEWRSPVQTQPPASESDSETVSGDVAYQAHLKHWTRPE